MSATSSPARRSAASSSGRESGLRPGASKASRTSATSASSFCGRAPRGGRGPSSSLSRRWWTSTRQGTPAYVISAATSAPDDSAASSSPSRLASADAATVASCRASSRSARRCSVVSSTENRAGSDGVLGPNRSQCCDCVTLQQLHIHRGRPPQQVVAQPQVVAALDPHPGRQQRRVPPRGVVPHPARRVDLALSHVRREVDHRHLAASTHRRRPARGRPAGATARPGSWGHLDTDRRRGRAVTAGHRWRSAVRARPSTSPGTCSIAETRRAYPRATSRAVDGTSSR